MNKMPKAETYQNKNNLATLKKPGDKTKKQKQKQKQPKNKNKTKQKQ